MIVEMTAMQKVRTLSQDLERRVTVLTNDCPQEKIKLIEEQLNKSLQLLNQSRTLLEELDKI